MERFRSLFQVTEKGFYCEIGNFYIDPWKPVPYAVITHSHSDHARPGMGHYLCTTETKWFLKARLGKKISIETLSYNKPRHINGVLLQFIPSGHIRGSAQVVLEYKNTRVIISGDYKRQADLTAEVFQEMTCDLFISEATFGFPVYQWRPYEQVIQEIQEWWSTCFHHKKLAILHVYSLGKAQRILAHLEPIHFLFVHPSIYQMNQAYFLSGFSLPHTIPLADLSCCHPRLLQGALYLLPPQVKSQWNHLAIDYEIGAVSGWYASKKVREKKHYDRYFVLSDHADWKELIQTIQNTQAPNVIIYHGNGKALAHVLQKEGRKVKCISPHSL